MSVRGTVFRVEVWKDSTGIYHTLLSVIEGTVSCELCDENGDPTGDIREFNAGEEAHMVEGTDASYYVGDVVEPELTDWRVKELEFIGKLFEYNPGADTFISQEQLNEYIDELILLDDDTALGASGRYMEEEAEETSEEVAIADTEETSDKNEEPAVEEEPEEEEPEQITEQEEEDTDEAEPVIEDENGEAEEDEPALEKKKDEGGKETDKTVKDKDEKKSGNETEETNETEGEDASTGTGETGNEQGGSGTGGESGTGGNTGGTTGDPNDPNQNQTPQWTVTFDFGNGITATKTVNDGDIITDFPSITPTQNPEWMITVNNTQINYMTDPVPITGNTRFYIIN